MGFFFIPYSAVFVFAFFRSLFFTPPAISYCELFLPYLGATPLSIFSFQSFKIATLSYACPEPVEGSRGQSVKTPYKSKE
jgi:hypothetical protein